jgi:hypothetical protein
MLILAKELGSLAPAHSRCAVILMSVLLLVSATAAQQPDCAELQALKKETYGFRPTKLSELQQTAKEKQIDRFRTLAESQGERGVRCLRGMLKSERTDSFFLFDGASLLLHLDDSQPSLAVVSEAAARSDLGEINAAGYVELVLELVRHGVDTTALAEKYMNYPRVDGFIAERSVLVDRATGAIFLYGSMPPERADQSLVPLLSASETDVRGAATLQLALSLTRESYRALAALASLDDLPEYARKQVIAALAYHAPAEKAIPTYAREQVLARLRALPRTSAQMEAELKKESPVVGIADDEPFLRSAIATLDVADLDAVREARRSALLSVSDESLYEYAAYTRIILGVINRLDLYKEYRVH